MVSIRPCDYSTSQRANFLHRFLGTDVLFSDKEHHVLNKLERMIQHQAFHFEIVPPAPVLSCEECPSNFDFRSLRIVTIKPTRSDHLLTLFIYYHKRAAGFQRFTEEDFEHLFFVAIVLWMLFPDERVGRDCKKIVPIFRPEWAELDKLAF